VNSVASITADTALLEAYAEWRRLSEQEGEAIRARDWSRVTECQNLLSALQPRIIRLTDQARQEWQRAGLDRAEKEGQLRRIISGLIELEAENSALLTAGKEAARKQIDQLDGARQNLKRVQRSYSPQRPAIWNSFS
jgi:hypothetical protein